VWDRIKNFLRTALCLIACLGIQYSHTIIAAQERILVAIKKPVVDLNTHSPCPSNLPASPELPGTCPRAHQEPFNKIGYCCAGDCYSKEENEVLTVEYPDIVYGFDEKTNQPRSTFCMYRKYVEPCSEALLSVLPSPVYAQEPTVVLTRPWNDFSVGTRFRRVPQYDQGDTYAVLIMDYEDNIAKIAYVPTHNALNEEIRDSVSKRHLFVEISNNVVDAANADGTEGDVMRVIPYVWGGSSFVNSYADKTPDNNAFYLEDGSWHRKGERNPYTGYDCSEFVMRMAKIAGIDFLWKTTVVIESQRPSLGLEDELQEGDLIWVKGHVMIVSNIVRGELIEACGYSSGYGRVHRIALKERFEDIESYADLLEKYYGKEPVRFKSRNGEAAAKSQEFKLLKLID